MKTSSNNNNIESNNNQEFFTKGKKYRCIKSVVMKKGGKTAFKAGNIYEQVGEATHWVGWLRNEQGERHGWPQPVYIADEVKTWGTKPEDIDPRLYFEPVEDVKEADFSDTLAYTARCKELEAEALAQMPYKVGNTVKSRDGVAGRVVEMYPEVTGDIDSPHLIYEYDGKPTVNVVILDADGKRHCAHWSFFTLQEASEIKDVPAADLVWDEDEDGVKVWGNIDKHAENLTKMGAKRGRVVFKSNKTGLPTGADCWVLPKTKSEDVRQYVRKVHERISRDFSEAREKYGNKEHKYHEGEKVMTIYGRGTVIRGRAWYASDEIDVQLDAPTYNYIWSMVGTPQKMVAVSRNDIVSIELPEPPKEIVIEDATLQNSGEIKPKAAFLIGDRVERKSDGERGTVDGYDVTDGKLTYIVKYDRTQRRQSDGFEYLSEELNGDELLADDIESLTAKYARQIEESALLGCGCMVGDGDETRKDSKCVKVRTAYKNDSHDAKDWTYCVSWYETAPIKGDADGQHQTLRECENGILLEQAARHMAYFELMARKGWTLDEILYGKAA